MRSLKTAAGEVDTVALDVMRAAFNLHPVQEQVPSSVSATGEGLNYIPAHELVAAVTKVDCPANFVPVAMIETGAKGAGYGAREEARS
jgi:hypothetical protein